ncbi:MULTISPECIES: hypothetical protein [unclassified Streptomyces]|uniref:hypothetical protein n=1 Tax=unclassified Streptomyces TaxID=2593676 RepID=UPI00093963BD|nr:hypothetical protein [Streptomyces sp. TSRI0281]OKI44753.1 hypothetical protein A6A29_33970 [Streptomyces sp. TSRI0281]
MAREDRDTWKKSVESYESIDGLWEKANADVPDSAARAEYAGLASLRDLAATLRNNAGDILTERQG